jgi:hypothetical protein
MTVDGFKNPRRTDSLSLTSFSRSQRPPQSFVNLVALDQVLPTPLDLNEDDELEDELLFIQVYCDRNDYVHVRWQSGIKRNEIGTAQRYWVFAMVRGDRTWYPSDDPVPLGVGRYEAKVYTGPARFYDVYVVLLSQEGMDVLFEYISARNNDKHWAVGLQERPPGFSTRIARSGDSAIERTCTSQWDITPILPVVQANASSNFTPNITVSPSGVASATTTVNPTPIATATTQSGTLGISVGLQSLAGVNLPKDGLLGSGTYEVISPLSMRRGESRVVRLEGRLEATLPDTEPSMILTVPTSFSEGGNQRTSLRRVPIYNKMSVRLDAPNFSYQDGGFTEHHLSNGRVEWTWNISAKDGAIGKQDLRFIVGTSQEVRLADFNAMVNVENQSVSLWEALLQGITSKEGVILLLTTLVTAVTGLITLLVKKSRNNSQQVEALNQAQSDI